MPNPGLTPAYTLRPATAEDFAFLRDLHVAAMRDYVAQTWGWDDAVQREMFAANFTPARSRIVLVDAQPVGVLAAERRPDCWFVANLAIAPAWQGRGLGAALLRDLLASAARDALPTRLQVLHVNPARHLYERLGFAIVGETPTHYLMEAAPGSASPAAPPGTNHPATPPTPLLELAGGPLAGGGSPPRRAAGVRAVPPPGGTAP